MRQALTFVAAGLMAATLNTSAFAQQRNNNPSQQPGAIQALPPALNAAMLSGNQDAISAAIQTLSGGNPQRAAQLSEQVVTAAEKLLTTNPQAAIAAVSAALGNIRTITAAAARAQTESVVIIASRILGAPGVQQFSAQAAALSANVLAAVSAVNNPTVQANVAAQVVAVAEKLVQTQPAAALDLAAMAVQVVKTAQVVNAAPQSSLGVVTVAARILVNPQVQGLNPSLAGSIAADAVQVVTNPAVFAAGPQAALAVASNAYAVASSPAVAAANPNALRSLVETLVLASKDNRLEQLFAETGAEINKILEKKSAEPVKEEQERASPS